MAEELSFEAARARLEQVVEQLGQGDLSLQEAIDLYEEGQALAQLCQKQLDDAEFRISELASGTQEGQ